MALIGPVPYDFAGFNFPEVDYTVHMIVTSLMDRISSYCNQFVPERHNVKFSCCFINVLNDENDHIYWNSWIECSQDPSATMARLTLGDTRKLQVAPTKTKRHKAADIISYIDCSNNNLLCCHNTSKTLFTTRVPKSRSNKTVTLALTFLYCPTKNSRHVLPANDEISPAPEPDIKAQHDNSKNIINETTTRKRKQKIPKSAPRQEIQTISQNDVHIGRYLGSANCREAERAGKYHSLIGS